MRQLQLFTTAELARMRDRTKSRNYSPGRDQFRREHERHREWGLARRHAERLRQVRNNPGHPPTAHITAPPPQTPGPATTGPSRPTSTPITPTSQHKPPTTSPPPPINQQRLATASDPAAATSRPVRCNEQGGLETSRAPSRAPAVPRSPIRPKPPISSWHSAPEPHRGNVTRCPQSRKRTDQISAGRRPNLAASLRLTPSGTCEARGGRFSEIGDTQAPRSRAPPKKQQSHFRKRRRPCPHSFRSEPLIRYGASRTGHREPGIANRAFYSLPR